MIRAAAGMGLDLTSAPKILRPPAFVAALTVAATLLVALALADTARADDGSTTPFATVPSAAAEPAASADSASPTLPATDAGAGTPSPDAAVAAPAATEGAADPAPAATARPFTASPTREPAETTAPASSSEPAASAPPSEPQGTTTITIVLPPLPAASTPDSGKPVAPGPDNGRPLTRAGPPRGAPLQNVRVAASVTVERPAAVQRRPDVRSDEAVTRITPARATPAVGPAALSVETTTVIRSRPAPTSAGAGGGSPPGLPRDRAPADPGAPSGLAGGVSSGTTGFALSTVAALAALVLLFPPWLLLALGVLPVVWREQLFVSVLPRPG